MNGKIRTRQLKSGLPFLSLMSAGKWLFELWKLWSARPICLRLLTDWARRAAVRADCTAGSKSATATGTADAGLIDGNGRRAR